MTKRIVALGALVCLILTFTVACSEKKEKIITQDEAYAIVLEDLGEDAKKAAQPHVHIGTYKEQVCFDIYLTVDGKPVSYVISATGEILNKGAQNHSH